MSRRDDNNHSNHSYNTADQNTQDTLTNTHTIAPFPPPIELPKRRDELRHGNRSNDTSMRREHQVIEAHRGRQSMVPQGVLPADARRVEEGGVGDEVGDEAEDVNNGEVDRRAAGGFAPHIEDGLWVEGERPADGVDPAEELGGYCEDGGCHRGQRRCWRGGWF